MSGSVNKVIIIGRLGKDPELRRTQSGTAVCSFTVATSSKHTDKQGQAVEETEWHNIVAWSKTAELCCQYIFKGSKVYIEGRLKTRSWDDNGQKRYTTEIVANDVKFLDSKPSSGGQQQGFQQQQGFTPQQDEPDLPF